ncbi:hypothetical protein OPV22_005691 [Ensete ventricosum]|uniref:Uncharacterized protein n=1 Tax=Ensete ventricosum TaxID=4639 RepID=A0AAV8RDD3_ENSVE|nr:hypothetical protein OPV22_005691 [Ensete ventricosum]
MRKLKFHEKKLLKKVNFIEYKREGGHREALVTRQYVWDTIQNETYTEEEECGAIQEFYRTTIMNEMR